jgi:hypothetical protein
MGGNPIASSKTASWPVPQTAVKPGKKPVPGQEKSKASDLWRFSFRYWQQIEYFGLEGKDGPWFISMLERMRELSRVSVNRIQTDGGLQVSLRYHGVNWGQTNIPIQRKDLISLPSDIRENENDYPFYQFSVSRALGRIAGFWDGFVFNIVLIDPYHNLQPSKDYDYKVTPTLEMPSEHETLLAKLNRIKNAPANCPHGQCSTQNAINFIHLENESFGIVYLEAAYFKAAKELVRDGKAKSVEELLELGILSKA